MFLRIIHGRLKPGTWNDFERAYREATAHTRATKGLCGRWLTRDLDDEDAGTTISLWATEADMNAYETSDLLKTQIQPKLAPFFSGDYRTTKSHVRFSEGDPSPSEWVGSEN